MTKDFSSEIMGDKKRLNNIFKVLKKNPVSSGFYIQ
jgi:hypothetical protein